MKADTSLIMNICIPIEFKAVVTQSNIWIIIMNVKRYLISQSFI